MALITCPDCQNQVSEKASYCPKCGCPIAEITKSANVNSVPVESPPVESPPAGSPPVGAQNNYQAPNQVPQQGYPQNPYPQQAYQQNPYQQNAPVQGQQYQNPYQMPKPKKSKAPLIIIIIVAVLIAGGVSAFFIFGGDLTQGILSTSTSYKASDVEIESCVLNGDMSNDYWNYYDATIVSEHKENFVVVLQYDNEYYSDYFYVFMNDGVGTITLYEETTLNVEDSYSIVGYLDGYNLDSSAINYTETLGYNEESYYYILESIIGMTEEKTGILFFKLTNKSTSEVEYASAFVDNGVCCASTYLDNDNYLEFEYEALYFCEVSTAGSNITYSQMNTIQENYYDSDYIYEEWSDINANDGIILFSWDFDLDKFDDALREMISYDEERYTYILTMYESSDAESGDVESSSIEFTRTTQFSSVVDGYAFLYMNGLDPDLLDGLEYMEFNTLGCLEIIEFEK
ncbi:MAG: hypothetical protein R3Y33_00415 [Clostridia bacterium]